MQDLRSFLPARIFACSILSLLTIFSLTGCCGSGTNSTTISTNNGGGGTTPTPTNRPVFVTVTPDGKFVYVADAAANSVAQFKIGTTGALTPLIPAMVTTGISEPDAIVISDDSQFAYVANQGNNTVALFKIGTTGALTPLSPATVSIKGTPSRFATVASQSDSGTTNFLYIGHTGGIARFEINSNGSLTSLGADAAVGPVADLTTSFDGDSNFILHILNASSRTVIDAGVDFDGSLNATSNGFQTGTQPAALVNSILGATVFAINQGANSISIYGVNGGGISGLSATASAGSAPVSGADVEGDGTDDLLVVNSASNTVSTFSYINNPTPTTLQLLGSAPTGSNPAWVAVSPNTGNGTMFAYVANQSGSISQYVFSFGGALIPLSPASVKA